MVAVQSLLGLAASGKPQARLTGPSPRFVVVALVETTARSAAALPCCRIFRLLLAGGHFFSHGLERVVVGIWWRFAVVIRVVHGGRGWLFSG